MRRLALAPLLAGCDEPLTAPLFADGSAGNDSSTATETAGGGGSGGEATATGSGGETASTGGTGGSAGQPEGGGGVGTGAGGEAGAGGQPAGGGGAGGEAGGTTTTGSTCVPKACGDVWGMCGAQPDGCGGDLDCGDCGEDGVGKPSPLMSCEANVCRCQDASGDPAAVALCATPTDPSVAKLCADHGGCPVAVYCGDPPIQDVPENCVYAGWVGPPGQSSSGYCCWQ